MRFGTTRSVSGTLVVGLLASPTLLAAPLPSFGDALELSNDHSEFGIRSPSMNDGMDGVADGSSSGRKKYTDAAGAGLGLEPQPSSDEEEWNSRSMSKTRGSGTADGSTDVKKERRDVPVGGFLLEGLQGQGNLGSLTGVLNGVGGSSTGGALGGLTGTLNQLPVVGDGLGLVTGAAGGIPVVGGILGGATSGGGGLGGLTATAGGVVSGLTDTVGGIVGGLPVAGPLVAPVLNQATGIVDSLPVVGGVLGGHSNTNAAGVASQASNLVNNVGGSATNLVSGLPIVGGVAGGVVQQVGGLTQGVGGTAGNLVSGLPVVGGVAGGVAQQLGGLTGTASNLVSGLPVVGGVAGGVVQQVGGLTQGATGGSQPLGSVLSSVPNLVNTGANLASGLPFVGGTAAGVLGQVQGTVDGATGQLSGATRQFTGGVPGGQLSSNAATGLVDSVTGTASGLVSGLPVVGGTASGILGQTQNVVGGVAGQVMGVAGQLPVVGQASNIVNNVGATAAGIAGGLPVVGGTASSILGQAQNVVSGVTAQGQLPIGGFPNLVNSVGGSASNIVSGLPVVGGTAGGVLNQAQNVVGGVTGQVTGATGQLPMGGQASDVVNGLPNVVNTAHNVASGLPVVGGTAADVLGQAQGVAGQIMGAAQGGQLPTSNLVGSLGATASNIVSGLPVAGETAAGALRQAQAAVGGATSGVGGNPIGAAYGVAGQFVPVDLAHVAQPLPNPMDAARAAANAASSLPVAGNIASGAMRQAQGVASQAPVSADQLWNAASAGTASGSTTGNILPAAHAVAGQYVNQVAQGGRMPLQPPNYFNKVPEVLETPSGAAYDTTTGLPAPDVTVPTDKASAANIVDPSTGMVYDAAETSVGVTAPAASALPAIVEPSTGMAYDAAQGDARAAQQAADIAAHPWSSPLSPLMEEASVPAASLLPPAVRPTAIASPVPSIVLSSPLDEVTSLYTSVPVPVARPTMTRGALYEPPAVPSGVGSAPILGQVTTAAGLMGMSEPPAPVPTSLMGQMDKLQQNVVASNPLTGVAPAISAVASEAPVHSKTAAFFSSWDKPLPTPTPSVVASTAEQVASKATDGALSPKPTVLRRWTVKVKRRIF